MGEGRDAESGAPRTQWQMGTQLSEGHHGHGRHGRRWNSYPALISSEQLQEFDVQCWQQRNTGTLSFTTVEQTVVKLKAWVCWGKENKKCHLICRFIQMLYGNTKDIKTSSYLSCYFFPIVPFYSTTSVLLIFKSITWHSCVWLIHTQLLKASKEICGIRSHPE